MQYEKLEAKAADMFQVSYLQCGLLRFPQLKDHHFANSRNADFELHIRHQTRGRGVDVVLNSLAQHMLQVLKAGVIFEVFADQHKHIACFEKSNER